jgi:hypothetical protein
MYYILTLLYLYELGKLKLKQVFPPFSSSPVLRFSLSYFVSCIAHIRTRNICIELAVLVFIFNYSSPLSLPLSLPRARSNVPTLSHLDCIIITMLAQVVVISFMCSCIDYCINMLFLGRLQQVYSSPR